eukprot:362705-Chlamydomonas_euryale.AAC.6
MTAVTHFGETLGPKELPLEPKALLEGTSTPHTCRSSSGSGRGHCCRWQMRCSNVCTRRSSSALVQKCIGCSTHPSSCLTVLSHDDPASHFSPQIPHHCTEARRGGFWSYVAGTAYRIVLSHDVSGIHVDNYRTTLPMAKGLSSSAAVCVLVARAFNMVRPSHAVHT